MIKLKRFFVLSLSVMFISAPVAHIFAANAENSSQSGKLDGISSQLNSKKKELDKLKSEERRIAGEISRLKKNEKRASARKKKLAEELSALKRKASETKRKYDSLETARKMLAGDLSGVFVLYGMQKHFYSDYYGGFELSDELLIKSALKNKHAVLKKMSGESAKVNEDLQKMGQTNSELKSKTEDLDKKLSSYKSEYKEKNSELKKSRERQAVLAKEVSELQKSARELTKLVSQLQPRDNTKKTDETELPIKRNSLPWPAEGNIISHFGKEMVPELKTWIVRDGIRIATSGRRTVSSVMEGKVIYAGKFRGYGNVVIIDHEKGFFTIYGMLSRIDVSDGQKVAALTVVGLSGTDVQTVKSGMSDDTAVYFEIRKGVKAVDPMRWLRNK